MIIWAPETGNGCRAAYNRAWAFADGQTVVKEKPGPARSPVGLKSGGAGPDAGGIAGTARVAA
jgi:hypothetical protein